MLIFVTEMQQSITSLLKALTAILLVSCITIESTGKGGMLISYLANKKYITENFCINKSNQKLHCNGKCYLVKQLKQEEKKEQSPAQPSSLLLEEEFIMNLPETLATFPIVDLVISRGLTSFNQKYISRFSSDIFHPPA